MRLRPWRRIGVLSIGALLLTAGACSDKPFDWDFLRNKDAETASNSPPASRPARDPVLAETIGGETILGGLEGMRVQGYGLVAGLDGSGSGDAPTAVRDYLIDYFSKEVLEQSPGRTVEGFSAQELIDSPDTAVVEIIGTIPAGAPKGTLFDVQVAALAGTSTRSLEGGLLLPCELKPAPVGTAPTDVMAGRTVARAGGSVFTNPFSDETNGGDPRHGSVLGGGRNSEPRAVRLMLAEPSYALARRIEQRVNERFGQRPKAAEAQSKGNVQLNTPGKFLGHADRFVQVATHLYIQNQPAYVQQRVRDLSSAIAKPGANYESIALIWEGIGRSVVPEIQPFFSDGNAAVRFYAARAALRLRDATALPVVAEIARTPRHPHRVQAVRELGDCEFPTAANDLVRLLDDEDQEVRIATYEALLQQRHSALVSKRFDCLLDASQLNFILDVVKCRGRPMIYVRRSRIPRITVFGENLQVQVPIFYAHPQDWVTINAGSTRDDLMLMARPRFGPPQTLRVTVPPRVADLIAALGDLPARNDAGKLRGLGLTYGQIVNVLDALCRDGSINARLVLEQTPMAEILGPQTPGQRPEADEEPPPAPDGDEMDEPRLVPRPPPLGDAPPPAERPEGGAP